MIIQQGSELIYEYRKHKRAKKAKLTSRGDGRLIGCTREAVTR